MIRKKICMVGAFAVGKTSLVQRYVSGIFSERYQTTVGVRIDSKDVTIGDHDLSLVLWDLSGEDEFQTIRTTYLRGSAGYFLVADATRRETLDTAIRLNDTVTDALGHLPFSLLVNKADLADPEIRPEDLDRLRERRWNVVSTSALSGDGVEAAFSDLAGRILA